MTRTFRCKNCGEVQRAINETQPKPSGCTDGHAHVWMRDYGSVGGATSA